MKKVLITGVSRGLGKILAEYLIDQDFIVYGTVRDKSQFEDSDNLKYISLDLQKQASIDRALEYLFSITDNLDAVIHNAGIAYLNPADELEDEERRKIFEVNFFGPIYLTEKILPYFRKSNNGKIIFISSIASVDPWPSLGVYSASKAALEKVAFEWAVLLQKWNISVSVIRANPLPTNMKILKSKNTETSIYGSVFCNELCWEKTDNVCSIISKILSSSSPDFQYTTGKFSEQTVDALLNKDAYQQLIKKYALCLFSKKI